MTLQSEETSLDHATAIADAVYAAVVETNIRAEERGEKAEIAATYHGMTTAFLRVAMIDEGGVPAPETAEWLCYAFASHVRRVLEGVRNKVEVGNFQTRPN